MYPLIKSYVAEDSQQQYLITKQGTNDNQAKKATAAADTSIGVVNQPGNIQAGQQMDVTILGEAEVLCGGSVSAGSSFTSDSNGKAVTASAGEKAVGILLESGVSGTIVRCLVSPHYLPRAAQSQQGA